MDVILANGADSSPGTALGHLHPGKGDGAAKIHTLTQRQCCSQAVLCHADTTVQVSKDSPVLP